MELFRTADYGQPDDLFTLPVHFTRRTTAELTALATAKQIGIGQLYYDTTASLFKVGVDPATISAGFLLAGVAINSTTIGATTPSTGSFTSLRFTSILSAITDSSGTPGNVTNNAARGRAAFAAAGTSVVVTSSLCAANSTVLVSLKGGDATLTSVTVTPAAGSFTVTGNAAATATTPFDFVVIGN